MMCISSIYLILQPHYGPEVDSSYNTNEYQEYFLGVKGRPVRKADNLTAIYESIV
jgi:hypothetical protein